MSGGGDGPRATTRARIIEATLRCVERWGLAKTTLEDVAVAAELSRATVYRYFPGGRDQLMTDVVAHEVSRFLGAIAEEVSEDHDLEAKLVHALVTGHRALGEHRLLHQVLSTEREVFLSELAAIGPLILSEVRTRMRTELAEEDVRDGVDLDEAADYLARLFLSYLGSPGTSDLADPVSVGVLVRSFLIGGIAPAPTGSDLCHTEIP